MTDIQIPNLEALPDDEVACVRDNASRLSEIAEAMLIARHCRGRGDISSALSMEARVQSLFEQLPKEWRW